MVVFKLVNGTISERVLVNTEPVKTSMPRMWGRLFPFLAGGSCPIV